MSFLTLFSVFCVHRQTVQQSVSFVLMFQVDFNNGKFDSDYFGNDNR